MLRGNNMSQKKITELKERAKPLLITNTIHVRAFGPHPNYQKEVLSWDFSDLKGIEKKIEALEKAKEEIDREEKINAPLNKRREEYSRIDHLLFEAIAEKENGKPEKMKAYLIERKKIKDKHPKI